MFHTGSLLHAISLLFDLIFHLNDLIQHSLPLRIFRLFTNRAHSAHPHNLPFIPSAHKDISVFPNDSTLSLFLIIFPLSHETVFFHEHHPIPFSFILDPIAYKSLSAVKDKFSLTMSFIFGPMSQVTFAILE